MESDSNKIDLVKIGLLPGCMGVCPSQVKGPCAAGIDVRPGSWDIVIGDVLQNPQNKVHVTRVVFVGKVRDEKAAIWILLQYKVRYAVVDTRPETTLAVRLQEAGRRNGIQVWRAEYSTAIAGSAIEMQENAGEGIIKLDRTLTLDRVWNAFATGMTIAVPTNWKSLTMGSFEKELTSSTRVPQTRGGKECSVWDHAGADHAFHAMNYLFIAIKKSNLISIGGLETMCATQGRVVRKKTITIKQKPDGTIEVQKDEDQYQPRTRDLIDFDRLMRDEDRGGSRVMMSI